MSGLTLCQQWTDQSGNGNHAIFPGSGGTRPAIEPARTEYASTPIIFDGVGQVTGQVARRLAVTGLTLSRQAHSVYMVLNPRVSLQSNALWEFRNTGGGTRLGVLYTSPTISGLLHLGNATNQTSAIRPRAQVSTVGFVSSATGRSFYLRETSASVAADTAATINEFHLGATLAGASFNTRADYLAIVCYPVAHTALEAQSVIDALNAIYSVPTTFTHRIIGLNDSIMEGFAVRRGLIDQLARPGAELFNMGIYGETHSTAYTNRAARFAGLYTAAYGNKKCVYLSEGGINDVNASVSAATLQTSITDMHAYLAGLGAGSSICRMTMLKNSAVTAGKETVRTDVNNWITAGSSGANAAADVASLPILANTADTAYYLDGAHPTQLGYAGQVATVNAAIDASMV